MCMMAIKVCRVCRRADLCGVLGIGRCRVVVGRCGCLADGTTDGLATEDAE